MMPFGCVTGRFQPVHAQHLALFDIALAECDELIVAVTNPDTSTRHKEATSSHRHTASANPFTYFERVRLLQAALTAHGLTGRTSIVPFDMTRSEIWPQYVPLTARQYVRAYSDWERQKAQWLDHAGYPVSLITGDPQGKLAADDIRAAMQQGGADWRRLVPPATLPMLDELIEAVPIQERG